MKNIVERHQLNDHGQSSTSRSASRAEILCVKFISSAASGQHWHRCRYNFSRNCLYIVICVTRRRCIGLKLGVHCLHIMSEAYLNCKVNFLNRLLLLQVLDKDFNDYLDLTDSDEIVSMSSIRVMQPGALATPLVISV